MTRESSAPQPEQVAAFFRKHRTGLVALVFTDLVDSTALLSQLGDQAGASFLQRRRRIIREVLQSYPEGEEIETAGDSFFLVFTKPSDAVRFALQVQGQLRRFSEESRRPVQERIGIHLGEVVIAEHETEAKAKDLYGLQIATCARVMSLARGDQILMTRGAFDSARQVLKGEDVRGVGALSWVSHGSYLLKGIDEPVEVCEVGETGQSPLAAPPTSDKAQRQVRPDEEPVLGWRPAIGQIVPNTRWVLEEKLGEGGFGEVWLGQHQTLKERHVFKFCFRAERVRSLKREVTLFRLLRERIGEHAGIVRLHNVYLEQPPFYLEEEYVGGRDLKGWCEAQGGAGKVPVEARLEMVAQVADALQAAHDAGIIHRDVKPGNILVVNRELETRVPNADVQEARPKSHDSELLVKLTDFGIGQVISAEYLRGITRAGFTETMAGSTSSGTGTTMYLAPEIVAGMPATTRSDIYSLGVVLYQLLVGNFRRPVATDWAQDISEPLLRADLKQCFAGRPEERFVAAGQLGQNLRALAARRDALAQQQAELAARERVAYRRGIVRTATLSALIVFLVALLALVAINQSRRAREAAARANAGEQSARQNLYAADMLLAAQALQANNRGRAVQLLERHRPRGGIDLRGWEWRYLWTLCRTEALPLSPAHNDCVSDVVFSPDGQLLYSCSEDASVKVWDVAARSLQSTHAQPFPVHAIALSPDGRWLVTGALDGRLMGWDTRTWTNQTMTVPNMGVVDLLFSPSGDKLVIRCIDRIRVVRMNDYEVVATLAAGAGYNYRRGQSMAFSPDGKLLAYPTDEGEVGLSDLKPDSGVRILPGAMDGINSIAFSPDNRILAAADWSPRIALWDLAANRELGSLTNHAAWISSVAFLPDGKLLLSASADQTMKYWETSHWQEVATASGHLDEVWCLAISPRGDWVATGGKDGALNLWSTRPPSRRAGRLGFESGRGLLSLDGQALLVLETNRTATQWDTVKLEPKKANKAVPYALLKSVAAITLGVQHLAVGRPDGEVEIWDSNAFQRVAQYKAPVDAVAYLKFSWDESLLAVRSSNGDLCVLDCKDGRQVVRTGVLPQARSSVEFSRNNKLLAVGLANGGVQVWSLTPTALRHTFLGQHGALLANGAAFSPDSRWLATGSPDATLRLWNLAEGSFVPLPRALMAYFAVAFSPDGQRIAAAGPDPVVKIIDTVTGQESASLNRNTQYRDFAQSIRFSADGNALLVMTDTSLIVWRTATPAEIQAAESFDRRETVR